jgi:hypothetical protein
VLGITRNAVNTLIPPIGITTSASTLFTSADYLFLTSLQEVTRTTTVSPFKPRKKTLNLKPTISFIRLLLDLITQTGLINALKKIGTTRMQTTIYVVLTPQPVNPGDPQVGIMDVPKMIAEHLGRLDLPGWKVKEVR